MLALVKKLAGMKKKPGAREGACLVLKAIAENAYASGEPYLVDSLPLILELCADKVKVVGQVAQALSP